MVKDDELVECVCGKTFLDSYQLEKHKDRCEQATPSLPESMINNNFKVTEEQCKKWRNRIIEGDYINEIEKDVPVCESTVQQHVNGICSHDHGVSSVSWDNSDREWTKDEQA